MKAAKLLQLHITRHYGGSASLFARQHRLDGSELSRILRGERGQRMSVKLAVLIRNACKGKKPEIPVELWAEE